MTLVLRYVDKERVICVGDTLVTLSVDDRIIDFEDEYVSKSFFVGGFMVCYSGTAVLNRFNNVELTTRDWVTASLLEALAEEKDIHQTLNDMASVLSGTAIIAPHRRGSNLTIGLVGVVPAPEDLEADVGTEFIFEEDFSFDDDVKHRWALIVDGHVDNNNYTGFRDEFTGGAKPYKPLEGKTYSI